MKCDKLFKLSKFISYDDVESTTAGTLQKRGWIIEIIKNWFKYQVNDFKDFSLAEQMKNFFIRLENSDSELDKEFRKILTEKWMKHISEILRTSYIRSFYKVSCSMISLVIYSLLQNQSYLLK